MGFTIRPLSGDDHPVVLAALAQWMDAGRAAVLLPRALLAQFADTSLIATTDDDELAGFVIAFESSETPGVGYIHFVWVSPHFRGEGLGRALYQGAMQVLRGRGCRLVEAVTTPRNPGAVAFHEHLGFARDDRRAGADIAPEPDLVVFTLPL